MAETLAEQADRERAERDRQQQEEALKAQKERDERTEEYLDAEEYVVLGPLVSIKMKDAANGGFQWRQFNEGARIKGDEVEQGHLRHLVEIRFLVPKDADEARFAGPAGTPKPGEPPNVPVEEGTPVEMLPHEERLRRQAEAHDEAEQRAAEQRSRAEGEPAPYASKGAWVDYAVSQGADRSDAESKSKSDLVAEYGSKTEG